MSDLKRRSAAEILAGLADVKMSKSARRALEEAVHEAYLAGREEGEAACTPEGLRETVTHSVTYAARAGYLEALRDVSDELQHHMGETHTAAVKAHSEAFRAMVHAPVGLLAHDGLNATQSGIDTLRGELRTAAEASPDRTRWMGVQPLTGLRELARQQAREESAVTVTVTTEGEETPR